jgi:60 kDa SS-A/Ro ribonucleoprotein
MANQNLFGSTPPGQIIDTPTTRNDAGGLAYTRSDETALAQMVLTGTFNDTFYASAQVQYDRIFALSKAVTSTFLAKLAIYAHEFGYMKDTPAFLLAVLTTRDISLVPAVFNRVITNGKMLRNFVQFIRSGAVGRKSFGSMSKRLIQQWLNNASISKLLRASIGNEPSLTDIVKMVHPKPVDQAHQEFFNWLIKGTLPNYRPLQEFTAYRKKLEENRKPAGMIGGEEDLIVDLGALPAVPFEMLMNLPLTTSAWCELADQMTWTQLRMNLNNLKKNGVFEDPIMVTKIAARLSDADSVKAARVFPYQLFTTYINIADMPRPIVDALATALHVALTNVPEITQTLMMGTDVSGSMSNAVTGLRKGATTKTRNIDVAALMTSAFVRTSKKVGCIPFDDKAYDGSQYLSKANSVFDNAKSLAAIKGGATSCQIPLLVLNQKPQYFPMDEDGVIIILSDYESWSTARGFFQSQHSNVRAATPLMIEWRKFRATHPKAKMVLIDISPQATAQVPDEPGVLNIGGFSDNVFRLVDDFINDRGVESMVTRVNQVNLELPTKREDELREAIYGQTTSNEVGHEAVYGNRMPDFSV